MSQRAQRTKRRTRGFSLVELLVVIGIIGVLIALLMPVLRKARRSSQQTVCASNLRQVGAAIAIYVNENRNHLPLVIEPFWRANGSFDFDADPSNPEITPFALMHVLKKQLTTTKVLLCPASNTGYPRSDPKVSYRISAANNFDGQVRLIDDLIIASGPFSGSPRYEYNLKFLNGRKYLLRYADEYSGLPFRLKRGVGPYYLLRDLLTSEPTGKMLSPHPNSRYNWLRTDFSVALENDNGLSASAP